MLTRINKYNKSEKMNWLNLFEKKKELHHPFGKGINADISPDEEDFFNNSYQEFENNHILNAYENFLNSLKNFTDGIENSNIIIKKDATQLNFELYQGSAKISGKITEKHFYAEVILVKQSDITVALQRYVLERNYQLTYARYFSDNNFIKLKLFHDNITMSPQKVFFPIRELALNADFDKEYFRSEFNIPLDDIEHIDKVDKSELQIKFNYIKKWIEELELKLSSLPSNDNSSMQAFLYLNFLFKIDYLLVPKFQIYQKINKKIATYFSDEDNNIESKNEELKRYIDILKEIKFESFSQNFYNAQYTFNPIDKTPYNDIVTFISESLNKIRWYKNNRYYQVTPTIYSYIAFYSLYNYGLNPVVKELFHLIIAILHPSFFQELGYKEYYNIEKNSFLKKEIKIKINTIIESNLEHYPALISFSEELNFNSINEFCNSFYIQLQNLDFEEI